MAGCLESGTEEVSEHFKFRLEGLTYFRLTPTLALVHSTLVARCGCTRDSDSRVPLSA
jgi:hypothetical protein